MAAAASVPLFKWAQDENHLFIAIDVPNLVDEKVELKPESFSLTGKSGKDSYQLNFEFSKTINVQASKFAKHRLLEFFLAKADDAKGFWPHLLKNKDLFKAKCKIDFDKWIDEDGDAKLTDKLDAGRFGAYGGGDDDMGMGGMPGMGGMGGMGGMPGMGGMGGMGGMMGGMPGMGGMGGMGGAGGQPDMAKLMQMLGQMKQNQGGDGPADEEEEEDEHDHDDGHGHSHAHGAHGHSHSHGAGGHDSDDEDLPDLQPADQ